MSQSPYLVLARKYRPTKFSQLKGQEHLTTTITNAIKNNRIAHSFLLTGIRGVGKTTSARIIARAINCLSVKRDSAEPCGECANCQAISSSHHPDILELDAASNTGVDDVRSIIEQVQYRPLQARYKVIIIDEVHMLSNNAFNALLKTLEEPPAHVKFIFATTELQKIPLTIISRCQRFDLRRLSIEELADNINDIAQAENIAIDKEAIELICRYADGSARDSLSLFDQAIAIAGNDKITKKIITSMLGIADQGEIITLFTLLLEGNIKEALDKLTELYHAGNDPVSIIEEMLHLTHLFSRLKATEEKDGIKEEIITLSEKLNISSLARLWQMLLKGLNEIRSSPYPLQSLEMLFIRISYAGGLPTIEQILQNGWQNSPANKEEISSKLVINNFQDLRNLCIAKREMILYYQLYNDIVIHEFRFGHIALSFKASASPDLESKLRKFLAEETGVKWVIEKKEGENNLTYAEEEQAEFERKKNIVKSDPLVRSLLENYQGAEIIAIEEKN